MSEPIIAKISLKKLQSNAIKVKGLLKKKVKFCAVVKSDAYGHGLIEISSSLYNICDYYAVSMLIECEKLRISGIDKPIIILTPPTPSTVDKLILNDIIIPVGSIKDLILVYKSARKLNKKVKVHFSINSGMNRLGFDSEMEINKAIKFIKNNSFVILDGGYSHFGLVEDKKHTESCFNKFKELVKPIKEHNQNAIIHVSSSGGLLLSPKYQLDMVRVGLLIYGYSPIKTKKTTVEPIMEVFAKNLLLRSGVLGKNFMYGKVKSKLNKVSIIRLGYADGFCRSNTSDFASNLCMDLSAVKDSNNEYISVLKNAEITAKQLNTIPYEVLTSVSKRAKREYFY